MTKTEALKQARNSLCDVDNQLFDEGKRTPAHVEQAIAAIDAALAEPEWLPIASAPKDGTDFLAWKDGTGQFVGRILDAEHPDVEFDGGVHESWSHRFVDDVFHWMPLPKAPQ